MLITNAGNALLADFGLSTTSLPSDNITATRIRARNTLRFSAPELLTDTVMDSGRVRSKTTATDIYAFGMLIYQVRVIQSQLHIECRNHLAGVYRCPAMARSQRFPGHVGHRAVLSPTTSSGDASF